MAIGDYDVLARASRDLRAMPERGWVAIDEEQFFLLQLSGPATQQSLQEHVYCQAEGVGERIPVRWIGGKERDAVLKTQVWDQELLKKSPDQFAVLACNRRLAPAMQTCCAVPWRHWQRRPGFPCWACCPGRARPICPPVIWGWWKRARPCQP